MESSRAVRRRKTLRFRAPAARLSPSKPKVRLARRANVAHSRGRGIGGFTAKPLARAAIRLIAAKINDLEHRASSRSRQRRRGKRALTPDGCAFRGAVAIGDLFGALGCSPLGYESRSGSLI